MRKHFLLLLLMTLLPLAGWATDYEVQVTTYDGTATWTGAKPDVQPDWFSASFVGGGAPNAAQKAIIATGLKVKDVDGRVYNAGTYEYQLALMGGQTISDPGSDDTYKIYLNSSTTATLTITQYTGTYVWASTSLNAKAELTYNGQAQQLLNGGATATASHSGAPVDVVYALSDNPAATDIFTSYDAVVATNKGDYQIYYRVAETDNYAGTDWYQVTSGSGGTTHLYQATTTTFNVSAVTGLEFNNTDQALLAKTVADAPIVPFGAEGLQYQIDGGEWTAFTTLDAITGKSAKNAVAYAVKFKIPADASANENWIEIESAAINVTIAKATPTFTTAPTFASGLTYTGEEQSLITAAGEATFGAPLVYQVRYSASTDPITWGDYSAANADYTTIKRTDAGAYQVRYFTLATDDLNQSENIKARADIAKADIPATSYTAPAAIENLKANGGAQALITAGSWKVDPALGEFQYKVGEGAWGNTVPKETAAGTYTVYSKIVATSNYNDFDLGSINVTIAAKDQVTIAIPAGQSFGYGTTPTLEYTADWGGNQGDDALDETGLTWSWFSDEAGTTPTTPGAIGDYYVKVSGLAVTGPTSANKEIVYPTAPVLVKITAGQVNASISGEATFGSLPTFTLTHVSGLSETEAATFNATNNLTTVTVKNGETTVLDGVAKNSDDLKTLGVGTYTLEATATLTNYNVVVSAGTLTVNPDAEFAFTIGDIAAVEYKAAKWEPEVTVTGLTKNTDYEVAYGDNTHDNINAGTGIVKITGIGNYAGASGSKTFTINKKDLTIKADDFTGDDAWTYGTTPEPTYTITATGWIDSETPLAVGSEVPGAGIIKVKRTSSNTVGMHTGALEVYFVDATSEVPVATPVATNYNLTLNKGNLQIAKAGATIQLKAGVAATLVGTYGISNADAKTLIETALRNINNYEVVEASMPAAELPYVDVASVTCDLADAEYKVNQNYSFTATGATSTNYGITIVGGSFTVEPAPITLYANDQVIDWSDTDPANDAADTEVKAATVTIAAGGLKYTDALTDVVASIVIESQNVGVNNISLIAKTTNANYNIIVNSDGTNAKYGVLTVTGAPALALSTADPDLADKLASYNGKAMPVTIDFSARNARTLPAGTARTWTANTWVTLTLPFDISVADLSKALGYAIVNVIDPSRTDVSGTSSKFYGKLTMKGGNGYVDPVDAKKNDTKLAANKPFMVKTADAITGIIDFGTQTIVAPASDLSVDAGGGAKFTGTYATKNVTSAANAAIWFLIGGDNASWAYINTTSSATWDILPFEGFIDISGSSARNMTFYFEELDGSTTAIKSINADDLNSKIAAEGMYNMNGMKLNTVPTQKGVYILNGKKVVIK